MFLISMYAHVPFSFRTEITQGLTTVGFGVHEAPLLEGLWAPAPVADSTFGGLPHTHSKLRLLPLNRFPVQTCTWGVPIVMHTLNNGIVTCYHMTLITVTRVSMHHIK